MRGWRAAVSAGAAAVVFGTVFHMQGRAVLGPESSFMYSNPDWVSHGIWIAAAGAAVLGAGIAMMLAGRR